MKNQFEFLLAGLASMAGSFALVVPLMSCGGDSPAPPPPPPPAPPGGEFTLNIPGMETLPSGSTVTVTQVTGQVGVSAAVEVKLVEAGYTAGAGGTYTKIEVVVGAGNQLTPIASMLPMTVGQQSKQQPGGTKSSRIATQVPQTLQQFTSGRIALPKLKQSTVNTLNSGGAPLSVYFAFPFGTPDALEAAKIGNIGVVVYDGNGAQLPASVFAGMKFIPAPMHTWPSTASFPSQVSFATFVYWLVNADDTPVRPEQLGMLNGARQFAAVFNTSDMTADFNFNYGMGLWVNRSKSGQDTGYGFWTGWLGGKLGADYSNCQQPSISSVQNAAGQYISSFASGDVIKVVVDGGYAINASHFQIGNTNFSPAVGVVAGPGPDERTYTLLVPTGLPTGQAWLMFRNKGATPAWQPQLIGTRCSSVTTGLVTVTQ